MIPEAVGTNTFCSFQSVSRKRERKGGTDKTRPRLTTNILVILSFCLLFEELKATTFDITFCGA